MRFSSIKYHWYLDKAFYEKRKKCNPRLENNLNSQMKIEKKLKSSLLKGLCNQDPDSHILKYGIFYMNLSTKFILESVNRYSSRVSIFFFRR